MKKILVALCAFWLSASACAADQQRHSLWSLKGKTNTVYLLGSVHFLNESEQLPAVLDEAYKNAEVLLMEIDMDDLDPAETQQVTLELGMLPAGQSLEQQLGKPTYAKPRRARRKSASTRCCSIASSPGSRP